jgi:hypothetical protein
MFSDGAFLLDAGWLFFAVWSVILIAFFVITFGEDLLRDPERRIETVVKRTQDPLRSASSHGR